MIAVVSMRTFYIRLLLLVLVSSVILSVCADEEDG